MILKFIIPALILVGISVIFFGINIFFKKNGKFPNTEIGTNPEMKKRGITCGKCEDMGKCSVSTQNK